MLLRKVQIRGFRSIAEMEIPFEGNGHRVLVGRNETGKSNMLKALNLLSGESFDKKDKKFQYKGDAYVRFIFDLDSDEIRRCIEEFSWKIRNVLTSKITTDLTTEEFIERFSGDILYSSSCAYKPRWTYWMLSNNIRLYEKWYVVNDNITELGLQEEILPGSYINKEFIMGHQILNELADSAIQSYFTPINIKTFYDDLRNTINEVIKTELQIPSLVWWKYNATDHGLPSSVNREAFSNDPNSCIPLKKMFLIAGIEEEKIRTEISNANENGLNGLKTLYDDVNNATNRYLKKVWREFVGVSVALRSHGDDVIGIGMEDAKSTFDFEQRSDGFRRLISFLLLMSIEEDTKNTSNLILIDEPEVGLHPSSARDLRNKLIDLGKNNLVIYATHSISMIDTENVKNNLVVTKEEEDTKFEVAKEDGTSPAENVYEAIGYSIYEEFKKTNVLLEGYTDKKTFKLFMRGDDWKNIGVCYTEGVSNIDYVTSMLNLGGRKFFVLSDGDNPAKQKKQSLGNPEYWFTYEDLGSDVITVEDFYDRDFFFDIVKKVLRSRKIEIATLSDAIDNNRIDAVKSFLKDNPSKKEIVNEIKGQCIKTIAKKKVDEDKIMNVLNNLLGKIGQSTQNGN